MSVSRLLCVLLVISLVYSASAQKKQKQKKAKNNNGNKNANQDEKEQAIMKQFFDKYCTEDDPNILKKLEACENQEPPEFRTIEKECLLVVANISKPITYKEIIKIECDEVLGEKYPKLQQTVQKIMDCGLDCYGLKHI
ncbi:unnamed protein product [Medioppia subpectinata]|uniref:Uncharacterized protein n=1 Tax=Medioppia subpectinata TaxID=1979941 RepID=A0A7R9KDH5_9ACAR|nr:unnamed protein product [Medioppia subpectinata]CAG2101497.1 unnamed protein product [Medioppia subpectinata]